MHDATFHINRRSDKPKAWLTPQNNISVAIRRNLGNIACSLLGHVILADLSASTVSRAEIRTGAALMSHAKTFFDIGRQIFQTADHKTTVETQPQPFVVHAFRQDATNSGIWKRSKLAALELESIVSDGGLTILHLKQLADVQKVVDGSANGTVAMSKKQLESLGCPTWVELKKNQQLASGFHVYVQTTDRGSNELAARGINAVLYNQCGEHVLYFQQDCVEHLCHLCVMGGLAEIDRELADRSSAASTQQPQQLKYFASCALLSNVLRDVSQGIFKVWQDEFGIKDAIQKAKLLWPKCLSGRWGSIHQFEKRCLLSSPTKLLVIAITVSHLPWFLGFCFYSMDDHRQWSHCDITV